MATANRVALNTFDLAVWAARDLSAAVTLDNPATSYLWAHLSRARPRFKVRWEDLKLSQCMFGTSWRKEWPYPVERAIIGSSEVTVAVDISNVTQP